MKTMFENYIRGKSNQDPKIGQKANELIKKYAKKIEEDRKTGKIASASLDEIFEEEDITPEIRNGVYYEMLGTIYKDEG
jgi:hypothetical protein